MAEAAKKQSQFKANFMVLSNTKGVEKGAFLKALASRGRNSEESKGYKIVNTVAILPDWYAGYLLW